MDISIIIVNWNTCELLRRCLASIQANCADLAVEIIVVDNASADDSVAMVRREFPQVRLIASAENLGYTGGNNLGAQEVGGRYLLILNPDTEIVGDALPKMAAYLDAHPGVGVVGPQLLYPDGSVQPSRFRFPGLMIAILHAPLCRRWFPNNKLIQFHCMADVPENVIQSVDWLTGAALMIRYDTWQEVGLFDERFFMYSDEVDWCHRCHKSGWDIIYLPMAQIVHYEKASAKQHDKPPSTLFYRSKIIYLHKYNGFVLANVVRFFYLMNYVGLLGMEVTKWIIGRCDKIHYQRIQTYWQLLKSGLK